MAKTRPVKRRPSKKTTTKSAADSGLQRLNKVLAAAGLGSRRVVEEFIVAGRVEVDREIVTDLACKVDPKTATIKFDGQALKKFRAVYFALNKPPGVLSTNRDPAGRMRVIDLVPDRDRVFSVGRLDSSSEGLMLLTNDGELAQRLAHPKYKIQKTYFVVVAGNMTTEELAVLRKGVHLAEGFARIDGATIRKHRKGCTEIEIVLSEGKNREIRRVLARSGHKVVLLRRIAIGPLRLGQMPVGASRMLTTAEVKALYAISDPANQAKKTVKKVPKPGAGIETKKKVRVRDDDDDDDDLLMLDDDSMVDADELGGFDEDFVGDFSGVERVGSVLSYDETETTAAPARKPKGGRSGDGRGAARNTAAPRTAAPRTAAPRTAARRPMRATSARTDKPARADKSERADKPARTDKRTATRGKASTGTKRSGPRSAAGSKRASSAPRTSAKGGPKKFGRGGKDKQR